MIRVEFVLAVREDFVRIAQHLLEHDAGLAQERMQEIESSLRGYVAKYCYLPERELVLITALRAQKESGCQH